MSLFDSQRDRVLAVMNELESFQISRMFAQPVDPERDNLVDYYKIVKTPMDLGTIRKKIEEDQYQSVAQWKEDVELVWSNSLLVHGKTSILGSITLELQNKFKKLVQHLTDNPDNDWMTKLCALRDELNGFSKKPSKSSSKKDSKPASRTSSQNKVSPKKQTSNPGFTKNDILKLTSRINNLKDEDKIRAIFKIIESNEPSLKSEGHILGLDVGNLKPATITELVAKINSWTDI